MFVRLRWFTLGTLLGAGGALWGVVRARQAAARLTPTGVQAEAVDAVRRLGADLTAAAAEGRAGMREAEDRIRHRLDAQRSGAAATRR